MIRIRSVMKIITNYLYYFCQLFVKTFLTTKSSDQILTQSNDQWKIVHPEEILYKYKRNNIVFVRRKPAPPIFFLHPRILDEFMHLSVCSFLFNPSNQESRFYTVGIFIFMKYFMNLYNSHNEPMFGGSVVCFPVNYNK